MDLCATKFAADLLTSQLCTKTFFRARLQRFKVELSSSFRVGVGLL
jgi:hypothetical protein